MPGGGGPVEIQAPPQGAVLGHHIVGVQVEPVGHSLQPPIVHGISGGGVARHRPPQGPVDGHGLSVGVHVEPDGQEDDGPILQGDLGTMVGRQTPLHVTV